MRIGKALTIPAIVTMGMAGPILASVATTTTAGQTAIVSVQAASVTSIPFVYYHS